jgi:anaerobic selenocysteine-containing dehydrogenase
MPDGSFRPLAAEVLMDEVAARLSEIVERYGPQAVAFYFGTAVLSSPLLLPTLVDFALALGSYMIFNPNTIDQPGKNVAAALHGWWSAPARDFSDPDVALLVGANPLVTYTPGLPFGHPGKWLQRWSDDGFELIVVDPRRSDTAKRATIFLQPRPGEDAAILAGMLRVIVSEGLYDRAFVDENVSGLATLRDVVEPFTPAYVATRADIDADDLVRAARTFARGERGFACAGTGPNMSGPGTLIEYLLLNLNTLCGRWLRAGEQVRVPGTLTPASPFKAQARAPSPAYGLSDPLPGTDLRASVAGLPTAGLPDAILHDGDDRVRALISIAGNPAMAWPDQLKAVEALESLDLLVQMDIVMSSTARLADYVVAPKMSFEAPAYTLLQDTLSLGTGYVGIGFAEPWAQYAEAIVDPPPASELVEEWEFLYGLAQRMDLQLHLGGLTPGGSDQAVALDMANTPTTEELLEHLAAGSRVPLAEVRARPHGGVFADPPVVVEAKDPECSDRFDVANPDMMRDLANISAGTSNGATVLANGDRLEFRLLCRRLPQVINSTGRELRGVLRRPYNPAFMHPDDLEDLGLAAGDLAEIRSARAVIRAVVEPDPTLRRGLVSMTHAFGGLPGDDDDVRSVGSNTGRLLTVDDTQPYTGQPQMSNVAVSVRALADR